MKKLLIFGIVGFFGLFSGLFAQQKEVEENTKTTATLQETTYYFPDALVYEYQLDSAREELWIFVNPETEQLLFVPNDDMIEAVISFPDGTYRIFGTAEAGEQMVLCQHLPEVSEQNLELAPLQSNGKILTVSQQHIQQPDITSKGFEIKYQKMAGGEIIYVTDQLPINSRQLYGLSRLDGDARLAVDLDYLAMLLSNQLITHISRDHFSLKLLDYGPNPYYFTTKLY